MSKIGRRLRVVIQARTTSSRLPGKALLPVAGIPSAVLCARRAKNRGADVVVATSTDSSDDRLVAVLRAAGLRVVRGPLGDVLARFHRAAADLPDDAIVVRLTADNMFPDGGLVACLAAALAERDLEYFGTGSPAEGVPYGLSAEAFTASVLRSAHRAAASAYDREHVTPWIIRKFGQGSFKPADAINAGHLRCTMDNLGDYLTIAQVFDKCRDPVKAGWPELVRLLGRLPGQPSWRVPLRLRSGEWRSELTVGTAQLGMDYGITNDYGKPSFEEARAILRLAIGHGVDSIDTARDYGDSEAVIGKVFAEEFPGRGAITTKLSSLSYLGENARETSVQDAVDRSVLLSVVRLRRRLLDCVLLHRWHHRTSFHGRVWDRLLELKKDGLIARLGVSVYSPHEAMEALADPDVAQLQLPFNILDGRWRESGFLDMLSTRPDVIIHVRSVLLQGLLASPAKYWANTGVRNSGGWAKKIRALVRELKRESALDLCIAYVRSQPWVTSLVMGVATTAQLEHNMRLFLQPPLTPAEARVCEEQLQGAPERLLNPSLWQTNRRNK